MRRLQFLYQCATVAFLLLIAVLLMSVLAWGQTLPFDCASRLKSQVSTSTTMTVTTTAQTFSAASVTIPTAGGVTVCVIGTVDTSAIRICDDGTTPTSTTCTFVGVGSSFALGQDQIARVSLIRDTTASANAAVQLRFYSR